MIDLKQERLVKGLQIEVVDLLSATLTLFLSRDGKSWTEIWRKELAEAVLEITVTHVAAGARIPGQSARYLKLSIEKPKISGPPFRRLEIYGE